MKPLQRILNIGIDPSLTPKEVNDLKLINSVSAAAALLCFILFFAALTVMDTAYLTLNVFTGLACVAILVSNYLGKRTLALVLFTSILPLDMVIYVYLFGNISAELYLIPGAIFAIYLLYPKPVISRLIFLIIALAFFGSKLILYYKYNSPTLDELGSVLFFPNVVLSFILIYISAHLYRSFQEEQRKELEESKMVRERMISILTHDLRSPIVSLKQLLEYAEREELSKEELRHYLKRVNKSLGSTSEMIDKVLHWANSQVKGMHTNKSSFDLTKLGQELIDLHQEEANRKGISLKFERDKNIEVKADRDMMMLAINNLVCNAIKFSPMESGEVKLSMEHQNGGRDRVLISIEDNGPGLSKNDLDHIFKMDKAISLGTDGEKGVGLGLLISREFITMNAGEIDLGLKKGKGTKLEVTLPVES